MYGWALVDTRGNRSVSLNKPKLGKKKLFKNSRNIVAGFCTLGYIKSKMLVCYAYSGHLDSVKWNGGLELWNGMEWWNGMEG